MAETTTAASRFLRSGTAIALAMAVMNLSTYGFTMIAARLLGPGSYGALVSMMNTLLVVGVLQLGLQATAARRIAAEPTHVAQIEESILRVTWRAALALGVLLLVLAPAVNAVLRLDNLVLAVLMAVTVVPMTVMGGQAGILQGERRWWPLGVLYIANGLPRLLVGTAILLWEPTELAAMVAVAVGQLVPVLVGAIALRAGHAPGASSEDHRAPSVIRETIHNSQALLAFFALSNVDIVVARNVLDGHEAGLYAGGLIMTKAVLFLPQFVVVVAFPTMSSADERRRALVRSLVAVAVLGAVATAGAALLSDLAMIFVGGDDYSEIEHRLWLFAVLGTALSMLQLLVYSVLARRGRRSVYVVWLALVALVTGGLATESLNGLLTVVVTVDAVLFVLLLAASLYIIRRPEPAVAEAD